MADPPPPTFEDLRAILLPTAPLRTWSVLVAVFGDLAPSKGDALSGDALREVLNALGIRAETLRVALHRLRKDGWIESVRVGRGSHHHLSPRGRAETRRAIPVIYGTRPRPQRTFLTILPPDAASVGFAVAPQIVLSTAPLPGDDMFSQMMPSVPAWIGERVCPRDVVDATRTLADRFEKLARGLPAAAPDLSAIHVAALRILAVHEWRRIALKLPDLADDAFPGDWRGADCRLRLAEILTHLPRKTIEKVEQAAQAKPGSGTIDARRVTGAGASRRETY